MMQLINDPNRKPRKQFRILLNSDQAHVPIQFIACNQSRKFCPSYVHIRLIKTNFI